MVTIGKASDRVLSTEEPESVEGCARCPGTLTARPCTSVSRPPTSPTAAMCSPWSLPTAPRAEARNCWSRRVGRSTSTISGWPRSVWTRTRTRSDVDESEHARGAIDCGRSADCTGQGVVHARRVLPGRHRRPRHTSVKVALRPTTPRSPASPSPTRRSAAVGLTDTTRPARMASGYASGLAEIPASTRGWIHKIGNEGLHQARRRRGPTAAGRSRHRSGLRTAAMVLSALSVAVHARVVRSRPSGR